MKFTLPRHRLPGPRPEAAASGRNVYWTTTLKVGMLALMSAVLVINTGCAHAPAKRVGMVTQLKSDQMAEYRRLQADANPGVRDLLVKYHLRNFSIFLQPIEGKWYEFGYYEYTGKDFDGDMARLAKEPRNIEWLKVCDPMQIPLPNAKGWTEMERVYFNW